MFLKKKIGDTMQVTILRNVEIFTVEVAFTTPPGH